jgi:beta-galactosidase
MSSYDGIICWRKTPQDWRAFLAGAGALIGVGNGDPNCHESDKAPRRSLFNGLAQLIVQAGRVPGKIEIEAFSDGAGLLSPSKVTIDARACLPRPAVV